MEPMVVTVLLLVVVAVLVAVLVAQVRAQREDRSIDGYRRALDTLEHLTEDNPRVQAEPSLTRAPHPREDGRPLVFDDLGRARVDVSSGMAGGRRGSDWALHRMENHHSTRTVPWIVGIGGVVVVLVLVLVGASTGGKKRDATPTTTAAGAKHHGGARATTTTATTLPNRFEPVPGSDGATYRPPANSYVLEVKVKNPCWTELVDLASGSTTFAGVVNPGSPQRLKVSGASRLSLSAPSDVAVRLDNEPVVAPPLTVPLVMTFNPAA